MLIGIGVVVVAVVVGAVLVLSGSSDGESGELTEELAGLANLIDEAEQADDSIPCPLDAEATIEDAGGDVPNDYEDLGAGAYDFEPYDLIFSCDLTGDSADFGGLGFFAAEVDETSIEEVTGAYELVYGAVDTDGSRGAAGGDIVEVCIAEVTDEDLPSNFCDYVWTRDDGGMIIALYYDGLEAVETDERLDVLAEIVPMFREALRNAQ